MLKSGLLDIQVSTCKMGDLNLMMENTEQPVYPDIDPNHPQRPFFTGYIAMNAVTEDGTRPFGIYIPKNYPISGKGVFVWMPDGENGEDYIEKSGLKDIAEKYNTVLILLQSDKNGWSKENINGEVIYSLNVFKKTLARQYFSINEATYYIAGFDEGAYAAATFGLLHPEVFSCILLDGDYSLSDELLKQISELRSDRDELKLKKNIAIPAWLVNSSKDHQVHDYLFNAGGFKDEGLRTDTALVYRQDIKSYYISADSVPMCEMRVTDEKTAEKTDKKELYDEMFSFASGFKRWLGIGNGDFRPSRTYKDMGLERKETIIDGYRREWFVYTPSIHKKDPQRRLPLVLAIHGYSCTGELYAENSHWHEVAEKRGFIVVYGSAWPSNKAFGGTTVPLPTWNCMAMEGDKDDMKYFREILKETQESLPIDPERIYVTGHSNGSLMTQTLMALWPEKFAAFAPQGAQFHMSVTENSKAKERDIKDDGVVRPVWLMMGEEDIGVGASLEKGLANDLFLNMMCRLNGLDRNAGIFLENGKYHTYTFLDEKGVPLLKFSEVKNLPHAYTPEMAWIYWDQFFSHFKRKADGSVEYTP